MALVPDRWRPTFATPFDDHGSLDAPDQAELDAALSPVAPPLTVANFAPRC
jgi:hypothetical protein